VAEAISDGSLRGDFWSGEKWHETWAAKRDDRAALPDGFTLTQAKDRVQFSSMVFSDLEGKKHSLADKQFEGQARIIEVFGSWCPNCHDASEVMNELHEKYAGKGLSIVGLAFEATGEVEKDAKQVKAFVDRHKLKYPVLLGGVADKEQVAKALPMIDRFRAYPTFIITDAEGKVEAIYTGFSGPATGEAYQKLKADFEGIVKRLVKG
jgi:thiol-disulfide isomerase/thioredoxin